MNNSTLKSIWAVFAGLLTNVILSVSTDYVLVAAGIVTPSEGGLWTASMLAVALAYRCVYTVAGGYVTAALAPDRPMRHVIILGSIGAALSLLGTVVAWNLPDNWYPIALVIVALPLTWAGGKLRRGKG